MLKWAWNKAKSANSAYSLARTGWRLLDYAFPTVVGGFAIWLSTHIDWIWADYGWFGALVIGLIAALISGLAVFLFGIGIAAFQYGSRSTDIDSNSTIVEITSEKKRISNETLGLTLRHYSDSDKDRIAEAFYELKEVLTKKANPLQLEVQQIWQIWNQRVQPAYDGAPLLLDLTLERVSSIELGLRDLAGDIHANFLPKFQSYRDLLDKVLLQEMLNATSSLSENASRLRQRLKEAKIIYEAAEHRSNELAKLIEVVIEAFAQTNSRFNASIYDSLRQIEAAEKIILTK